MNPSPSRCGDRIPTVSTGSTAFLEHLRLLGRSERTLRAHGNALCQFGKVWGERDLREVGEKDLAAYAAATLRRVSRESAYLYLHVLRLFFRFLVEQGVLLLDPSSQLPMPRMRERLTGRIPSPDEMKALIESPDTASPVGLRDRALLEFLYSTGLRVTESRLLEVPDLGTDAVTVRNGKGGKDRVVPVGRSAMGSIRRYLLEARPGFLSHRPDVQALWVSRWGRPFGEQTFRLHLRHLGDRAGIPHLTGHMIRRAMATHLLAAGASPAEVSGILGHSDLHSLSRYVRIAAREVKETHGKTHPREVP